MTTETRPTGEQLRFVSAATGSHILDTYLEAAEKGGRTLGDMLADLFDETTGLLSTDIFTASINLVIDSTEDGVMLPGLKGSIPVPFNCTINSWTLIADQTGSITVDVWKSSYNNAPPTASSSITASAKPTISNASKATSSTLTGWTTFVNAGDILSFKVDSVSSITRVTVTLKVTRS